MLANAVRLILSFPQVSGSNLGWKICYSYRFLVFLSSSRQMPGYHLKLGQHRFLLHNFNSLFTLSTHHWTV
jgi:hypothetical protein